MVLRMKGCKKYVLSRKFLANEMDVVTNLLAIAHATERGTEARRRSFQDGYPADIRGSFGRHPGPKTSIRRSKSWQTRTKCVCADIHDSKARMTTSMISGWSKKLRTEKLWKEVNAHFSASKRPGSTSPPLREISWALHACKIAKRTWRMSRWMENSPDSDPIFLTSLDFFASFSSRNVLACVLSLSLSTLPSLCSLSLPLYLSISLALYLSISLSLYLSISLSLYLYVYLSLYICIYLSISICLSVGLSMLSTLFLYSLPLYLSISLLSLSLSLSPSLSLSLFLCSPSLSALSLSFCALPLYLSLSLFVILSLSIFISIYIYIYIYIYLSTLSLHKYTHTFSLSLSLFSLSLSLFLSLSVFLCPLSLCSTHTHTHTHTHTRARALSLSLFLFLSLSLSFSLPVCARVFFKDLVGSARVNILVVLPCSLPCVENARIGRSVKDLALSKRFDDNSEASGKVFGSPFPIEMLPIAYSAIGDESFSDQLLAESRWLHAGYSTKRMRAIQYLCQSHCPAAADLHDSRG